MIVKRNFNKINQKCIDLKDIWQFFSHADIYNDAHRGKKYLLSSLKEIVTGLASLTTGPTKKLYKKCCYMVQVKFLTGLFFLGWN